MQTIRCRHLLGPHECRMGACSTICVGSQIALDFGLKVMCENCNYSVSYVEGRRGQYNLKIISAWHHCIVYSFNNGFVNHAKIYPGLIWMVCYGAVLVAGLRLDSIGEPSCTGKVPSGHELGVNAQAWVLTTTLTAYVGYIIALQRFSAEV